MSIHMHMDGVTGESSDSNHKDWIDIIQLTWSSGRRITSHTSTQNDRESANAEISELTFTKHMDSATPQLFIESCCGRGKTITVELTRTGTGNGAEPYTRYVLYNALLSDYRMAAWSEDDGRPMDKLKISFSKLEVAYIPHDKANNPLPQVVVGFDTSTNERV